MQQSEGVNVSIGSKAAVGGVQPGFSRTRALGSLSGRLFLGGPTAALGFGSRIGGRRKLRQGLAKAAVCFEHGGRAALEEAAVLFDQVGERDRGRDVGPR